MKKAFNLTFLAISALLMLGHAVAFAQDPAVGQAVGTSIQGGVVTYRVNNDFAALTYQSEKTYPVTITGLDADGLEALGTNISLEVPVTFREKLGEKYYRFYVTQIAAGLVGTTKQSFYGYTEISALKFTVGPDNTAAYPIANFTYTVGTKAFYGCTGMKSLEFTENCSYIGTYAFQNTAIKKFEIPKKCATVDTYAFYNCKRLQEVTVASGNTDMNTLGNFVFGNSALKTLDLRNAAQLWTITGTPFMYDLSEINDVLTTVYLPSNVKAINQAFANCTALTNIYGFDGTKLGEAAGTPAGSPAGQHILDKAFENCRSLTRLDIPSCNVIGSPFVGCAALDTLTFVAYYNKTIGQTLTAGNNVFGDYDPNDGSADDAEYNEAGQKALKVIEFKGILNGTIQNNAFVKVTALEKVDFKGKLRSDTHIKGAFTDVTTLTDVIFNGIESDGVADVTIEANAFRNTGIAALDFKGITLKSGNDMDFQIWANAFSDCANLADIKTGDINIQNNGIFSIAGAAFTNNPLLANVTFGATAFTGAGTITIANNAFAAGNVALAAVEWGNITSTIATPAAGFNSTITIGTGAQVFGDTKALATVKFGTIDAGTFSIGANAFKSSGLTSVEFGNIKTPYAVNSNFTIGNNAFASAFIVGVSEPESKTVKFGDISENNVGQMVFTINNAAFKTETSLTSVDFGNITAQAAAINFEAFKSAGLQTVKLGDIKASGNANSTFNIINDAFADGKIALKTVTIGKIQDNGTKTLTASIGFDSFKADSLQSVTIGDMTATSLTIGFSAFEGKALSNIKLGKMTAATLNIPGNMAFANTNNVDAMVENIEIGEIGAGLNITGANVFQGPQVDGSKLNVTIDKITAVTAIPAPTFVAPAKGEATYTISGDVLSTAGIVAGAFVGSKENIPTPVENTTTVTVKGDYNADFAVGTFTNVNEAIIAVNGTTAKEYGVLGGELGAFDGVKVVTVGNIAAGKSIAGNTAGANQIKEITFMKSVAGANAIGIFQSFDVRKIEFANVATSGVKVAAGAAAAAAFQNAGAAAAALNEKISVIYREEQTREAEVIFDQTAFAAAAGTEVATLYTTSWAKANVYEAADVAAGTQCVFRMAYSESEVAPGEAIEANVIKKEGNTYGYAKLYIPKGVNMKYKVPAKYDATSDKNGIQLYYGRIDNSNNKIYMYNLPVIDDYYWIDATDVDQQFVMRVNSTIEPATVITAEAVTAEEDAIFTPGDADHYYFGAALAVQNQLRYNPAEIANQELRNNAEFAGRAVYVMANPASYTNLTFAKFNKEAKYPEGHEREGEYRALNAKSLYIVGKVGTGAPELEVVFEGDENFDGNETTGIKDVKSIDANDGAIYNLQGVRVNNATKGIFIQNGKKYVIK